MLEYEPPFGQTVAISMPVTSGSSRVPLAAATTFVSARMATLKRDSFGMIRNGSFCRLCGGHLISETRRGRLSASTRLWRSSGCPFLPPLKKGLAISGDEMPPAPTHAVPAFRYRAMSQRQKVKPYPLVEKNDVQAEALGVQGAPTHQLRNFRSAVELSC